MGPLNELPRAGMSLTQILNSRKELNGRIQAAIRHKAEKVAEHAATLKRAQEYLAARQSVLHELERVIPYSSIASTQDHHDIGALTEVSRELSQLRIRLQAEVNDAEEGVRAEQATLNKWRGCSPAELLFFQEQIDDQVEGGKREAVEDLANKRRLADYDKSLRSVVVSLNRDLSEDCQHLDVRLSKCSSAYMFFILGLSGILIIPLMLWMQGLLHQLKDFGVVWITVELTIFLYWMGMRLAANRQLVAIWKTIALLDTAGFVIYRVYGTFGTVGNFVSSQLIVEQTLPDPALNPCYVQYAGTIAPKLNDYDRSSLHHSQPMILTSHGLDLLNRVLAHNMATTR